MIIHQPSNSRKNFNYNAYIYTNKGYSSHFHSNYELVYVMEGTMPFVLNGVEYTLSEGELLLLAPYAVHSFELHGKNKVWIGVFSDEFIPEFAKHHKDVQFSKFRCSKETEDLLKNKLFTEDQPERYLCIAYLYMVCNDCVKYAHPISTKSDRKFMQRVIDYISENLNYDIKMSDIARELSYEYHYFSSVFNECFSMNFKSFLNIFRIEKACELLLQSKEDITCISKQCGFSSIRNFNRVFKDLIKCTPSEYRSGK